MASGRIISSAEEFISAINKFGNCKDNLSNAYNQMNSALFMLDGTWNGEASEAFMNQFRTLSGNLMTSDETIDGAIKDLQTVVAGHEEMEAAVSALLSGTSDTTDPFV